MQLSIEAAVQRALEYNLGVLLAEGRAEKAGGTRLRALAELLPNVTASVSESRRRTNLEAFGFPLRGEFPRIVGPFNVFDARLFVSQALVDLSAVHGLRAAQHELAAERYSYRGARDLVVLVSANLYLQALAADARAQTARAQLATAEALHRQAVDLRQSGIVPGIDVVRAEVRVATERQRATFAENAFQKARLQLARAIGLPLGQPFALTDQLPYVPAPDITLEAALERAYRERPDYHAALERLHAAESTRASIASELLPSVRVTADYGAIGLTAGSALSTFSVAGAVDVPIFQGGRVRGRLAEADAELRARRVEADDARAAIYYEVRSAFLDLQATEEELKTAARARELGDLQLTQARDRFAAGVATNIEVIQSQEAVALASEQYIEALYGFNVAKATLARSVGTSEAILRQYLGGGNVR